MCVQMITVRFAMTEHTGKRTQRGQTYANMHVHVVVEHTLTSPRNWTTRNKPAHPATSLRIQPSLAASQSVPRTCTAAALSQFLQFLQTREGFLSETVCARRL